jgi:hypothetical protein
MIHICSTLVSSIGVEAYLIERGTNPGVSVVSVHVSVTSYPGAGGAYNRGLPASAMATRSVWRTQTR